MRQRILEGLAADESNPADVDALRRRVAELDKQVACGTKRLLQAPDDVADLLAAELSKLRQNRDRLARELSNRAPAVDLEAEADALADRLWNLAEELRKAPPPRLRGLVHQMVTRIELRFHRKDQGRRTIHPFAGAPCTCGPIPCYTESIGTSRSRQVCTLSQKRCPEWRECSGRKAVRRFRRYGFHGIHDMKPRPQPSTTDELRTARHVTVSVSNSGSGQMSGMPVGYEQKFPNFIRLCAKTSPGDYVVVATPHALDDTYDESIESLNRLADAEVRLVIVPRKRKEGTRGPKKCAAKNLRWLTWTTGGESHYGKTVSPPGVRAE